MLFVRPFKIELTTDQEHHIADAIGQLESSPNRSSAEEMVLGVLQAILPERLPTSTQLLANSETRKMVILK